MVVGPVIIQRRTSRMIRAIPRRRFLSALAAAPLVPALARYHAMAAPVRGRVKIRDVKVMVMQGPDRNYTFCRIDTDAGVSGIGEGYGTPGIGVKEQVLAIRPPADRQGPARHRRHLHRGARRPHRRLGPQPHARGEWRRSGSLGSGRQAAERALHQPARRTIPRPCARLQPRLSEQHARSGIVPRVGRPRQSRSGRLHRAQVRIRPHQPGRGQRP